VAGGVAQVVGCLPSKREILGSKNCLINIDINILNNILANEIRKTIKEIMHHDQVRLNQQMQGCFNS
jgi:hypothetical protein